MTFKIWLLTVAMVFSTLLCSSTGSEKTSLPGDDMTKTNYQYYDGSNNHYTLDQNTLTYDPVTPEMSSSGIYSGGEKFTIELDQEKKQKLVSLFNAAYLARSEHQTRREKGTGNVIIQTGQDSKSCILRRDAVVKTSIENYLSTFKTQ